MRHNAHRHARPQPRPVAVPRSREPRRSTSSSRCRSTCRSCSRASASPRCRPRAAARGPASSATSRSSTRASGARGAPSTWSPSSSSSKKHGYGSVYFVDDHFLLQPKRIEAICKGIMRRRPHDPVGLRRARRLRRAWTSSPPMAKAQLPHAHVRDRERQPEDPRPPEEGADARRRSRPRSRTRRRPASRSCTGSSSWATRTRPKRTWSRRSDFASRLPLDTFAFNRLCVYRGTPLWQEYVQRGLVNDADRLVQVLQVLVDRPDGAPRGE